MVAASSVGSWDIRARAGSWYKISRMLFFFCIPLHTDSQYLFAFEWTNPETIITQQYTCTVLPQGFRDSPYLFSNALAWELRELEVEREAALQDVDDILVYSSTKENSDKNTIQVLNSWEKEDYQVSPSKAQISKMEIKYLGYILSPGNRILSVKQ